MVLEREGHFIYYLVRTGRMYIYIYIYIRGTKKV